MRSPGPRAIALALSLLLAACVGPNGVGEPRGPLRVLILGDSISIGYTSTVRELLADEAVVVRPTLEGGARPENCAGTTKGKEHTGRWLALEGGPFELIHFNFGLHDLKRVDPKTGGGSSDPSAPRQADLERYTEQLRQIALELQASGAALIFATTTPVPEGGVKPHRDPEDVVRYNEAAVSLMGELGIAVDDLYAFALPRLGEIQRPINVHFTPAGSRALGEQVVRSIHAAAE